MGGGEVAGGRVVWKGKPRVERRGDILQYVSARSIYEELSLKSSCCSSVHCGLRCMYRGNCGSLEP